MKITNKEQLSNLEKKIETNNLTLEELYNLYTNALLENTIKLKQIYKGDKLEISLIIKYLLENNFPANKIVEQINSYYKKRELVKLIRNNKDLFKGEKDIQNLIDFINGFFKIIRVSQPLDNRYFFDITQNKKTMEIIKDYILSAKKVKEFNESTFYQLEIRTFIINNNNYEKK